MNVQQEVEGTFNVYKWTRSLKTFGILVVTNE